MYATFSGPAPRATMIWAAVLAVGKGAAVSHLTAAELVGLADRTTATVHVSVPATRRVMDLRGVVIHLSQRLDTARHPTRQPSQTRIEETVLDLVNAAESLDAAMGWLTAACSRRLTTPDRLMSTLDARLKIRWRREVTAALQDTRAGCMSPLELRYVRDVERAHGLPPGERQVRHARIGGNVYDDVRYAAYGLVAELDGRVGHPLDAAFRDLRRDNVASVRGDLVLHYGWTDVDATPCRVAVQVGAILTRRAWPGHLQRCNRPDCVIAKG